MLSPWSTFRLRMSYTRSMERFPSVSWAESKLVMQRVGMPRHRSTARGHMTRQKGQSPTMHASVSPLFCVSQVCVSLQPYIDMQQCKGILRATFRRDLIQYVGVCVCVCVFLIACCSTDLCRPRLQRPSIGHISLQTWICSTSQGWAHCSSSGWAPPHLCKGNATAPLRLHRHHRWHSPGQGVGGGRGGVYKMSLLFYCL